MFLENNRRDINFIYDRFHCYILSHVILRLLAANRELILVQVYTCQLSHLRRESHACGLKTSISHQLTGQFLIPD